MNDSHTPLSNIIAARTAVATRAYARDPELAEAATAMLVCALGDTEGEDTTAAAVIVLNVARQAKQAAARLAQVTANATKLALTTTSADGWAAFAVQLAGAEGAASAWSQLDAAVTYSAEHGRIDRALVIDVALRMLAAGADDEWSGRVNDVQRARFDGVREACSAMRWM